MEVVLAPGPARDLGGGGVLTQSGWEVRMTSATLVLHSLELRGSGGAAAPEQSGEGGNVAFDPANPPAGFSQCHGGHCHAEDGSLPTYEEIAAMAAGGGGGGGSGAVATLPLELEIDLRTGARIAVDVGPAKSLGPGEITQVALVVEALRVEAMVTGGGDAMNPASTVPLSVTLDELDQAVVAAVDVDIGRDASRRFALGLRFHIDATLFDDIDFSTGVDAGAVQIDAESEQGAAMVARLLGNPLVAEVL
jgi:hypothetical protein